MRHQYTVRGVSPELDARVRDEARVRGTSINGVVVDMLEEALLSAEGSRDDLDWFIGGQRGRDPDTDAALAWLRSLPTEL